MKGSFNHQYEQEEWLQQEKHVSVFVWEFDYFILGQTWKIMNLSFKMVACALIVHKKWNQNIFPQQKHNVKAAQ